jgi:hypothetical protein
MTAAELISAGASAQKTSEQCFQLLEVQLAALKGKSVTSKTISLSSDIYITALEAVLTHTAALFTSAVRFGM